MYTSRYMCICCTDVICTHIHIYTYIYIYIYTRCFAARSAAISCYITCTPGSRSEMQISCYLVCFASVWHPMAVRLCLPFFTSMSVFCYRWCFVSVAKSLNNQCKLSVLLFWRVRLSTLALGFTLYSHAPATVCPFPCPRIGGGLGVEILSVVVHFVFSNENVSLWCFVCPWRNVLLCHLLWLYA